MNRFFSRSLIAFVFLLSTQSFATEAACSNWLERLWNGTPEPERSAKGQTKNVTAYFAARNAGATHDESMARVAELERLEKHRAAADWQYEFILEMKRIGRAREQRLYPGP